MAEEGQAEVVEAAPQVEGAEQEQQQQQEPEGAQAAPEAPVKTYSAEEMERIVAKVRKNTRYNTKREIEAFYQGRDTRPQPQAAPVIAEDKPPAREAFESYEAYIEEKAAYHGRKAAREFRERTEQESRQQREQQSEAQLLQGFQKKLNEKFPDLEDRAEAVAHIQMPPGMSRAMAESDLGPEILDHLVSNPKELERIAALSPSAAIREVGKLEARLEADAKKPAPPKAVPSAPAPIKPGGNLAAPVDSKPSDDDDMDTWLRKERERMRKKRA